MYCLTWPQVYILSEEAFASSKWLGQSQQISWIWTRDSMTLCVLSLWTHGQALYREDEGAGGLIGGKGLV